MGDFVMPSGRGLQFDSPRLVVCTSGGSESRRDISTLHVALTTQLRECRGGGGRDVCSSTVEMEIVR
jgi:hypothetical protein